MGRDNKISGRAALGELGNCTPAVVTEVSKIGYFLSLSLRENGHGKIIKGYLSSANTGEEIALFQPISLHFSERRERYRGQASCFTRKLCLQSWTQFLQKGWYCRRPVSPRKKAHSIRHFLLRLIDHHAPGCCGQDALSPRAFVPRIPVSRPPAVPGWRALPFPVPHPGGHC